VQEIIGNLIYDFGDLVGLGDMIFPILMGVFLFFLLFLGFPVAVALATSGFLFAFLAGEFPLFNLLPIRIFGVVDNQILMAIPLFVFMGVMLERSRLAEELLDVIGHAAGGLRGGMGLAIILVGVLMGASTGIVGATVVTLGLLTLPVFLRRGYSKSLACGTICASGTLGQIIPPSLVLILLSDILGTGLGTLFAAAMIPGLLLAGLYAIYMLAIGWFRPDMAPAIPAEERDAMSRQELIRKLFFVVLPPIFLIFAVLGSIIGGIAAPTEAASMGGIGSILIAYLGKRLTKKVIIETVQGTLRISAMVFFILIAAQAFSLAFRGLNGDELIEMLFEFVPGGVTHFRSFDAVPARLLPRMDRDLLHRPALVLADPGQERRRSGVVRDSCRSQPADLVPDTAGGLGAVFPERGGAARSDVQGHLRRRHAVRGAATCRVGAAVPVSVYRHLAAESHRLVTALN